MKSNRRIVELDVEQLQRQLDQIERELGEETARPFRLLLGWYLSLLKFIQKKGTTIGQLRKLVLGAKSKPAEAPPEEPGDMSRGSGPEAPEPAAQQTTADPG